MEWKGAIWWTWPVTEVEIFMFKGSACAPAALRGRAHQRTHRRLLVDCLQPFSRYARRFYEKTWTQSEIFLRGLQCVDPLVFSIRLVKALRLNASSRSPDVNQATDYHVRPAPAVSRQRNSQLVMKPHTSSRATYDV
jgi:hypothetical protein